MYKISQVCFAEIVVQKPFAAYFEITWRREIKSAYFCNKQKRIKCIVLYRAVHALKCGGQEVN